VPTPAAKSAAVAQPSKSSTALVANRPPVPLLTPAHHNYFKPKEVAAPGTSDKATGDKGTSTANSLPSNAQQPADGQQLAVAVETKPGDDRKAKSAVEQDGYKNVRALVKDDNGVWRGRAMRGRTEIAIRVNPDGSVSQD